MCPVQVNDVKVSKFDHQVVYYRSTSNPLYKAHGAKDAIAAPEVYLSSDSSMRTYISLESALLASSS
jgi:hypothetical protein